LIVTLGWTFNLHYGIFILQVIWAFGISMIVLSGLLYARRGVLLAVALLLIAGHDALDGIHVSGSGFPAILWSFLHVQAGFTAGRFNFFIGYPILPWIGLIALGYWFGELYHPDRDPTERRRLLSRLGWGGHRAFHPPPRGRWLWRPLPLVDSAQPRIYRSVLYQCLEISAFLAVHPVDDRARPHLPFSSGETADPP
jgi:uncharacterized membrane protein